VKAQPNAPTSAQASRDSLAGNGASAAVLEASPNAIVGVDASGLITYLNEHAALTFGYAREELIREPIERLLPEEAAARHVVQRDRLLARPVGRPHGIGLDLAGRRKDGSQFPVEISLTPVDLPDGPQVFATIVDITARKAAEQQLLEARKLESIGRLAGGIAHDFNNVLFAIKGYAELLTEDLSPERRDQLDADEARKSVEAIGDAATRAATLTAQLLSFSRRQMIRPEVVDLNEAISGVEPLLRPLLGEPARLFVNLDPEAGRLRVDHGQLDQILINLVINARDAMPAGGTITIESGNAELDAAYALLHPDVVPGPYVYLSVIDTGQGMDPETREHIFEPFFTTKAHGQGTGLGLATTYGIVHQSAGHIEVESEPGKGASFTLYFPRVDAPAEIAKPRGIGSTETGSGSIMVVEDESSVRELTSAVLRRAGYQVTAVSDGADAMARLDDQPASIDVLVTDVVMPGMSGIDLAEQVIERFPAAGIVLLSGYNAETLDLDRVVRRGAIFLPKPVASSDLLDAVRRSPARRAAPDTVT
jgi:two-component system, cell cycle sensor histidine kinase and response regulator CckA